MLTFEKTLNLADAIPRCSFYVNIIKRGNYESFVCQKRKEEKEGRGARSEYSRAVAFYFERKQNAASERIR